ncbi:hypothetical protein [Ilyobacter sp.]
MGALSTAGPDQRFTEEKFPEIIRKVKETAMNISRELGYKG